MPKLKRLEYTIHNENEKVKVLKMLPKLQFLNGV
jgi:hypothetical protein